MIRSRRRGNLRYSLLAIAVVSAGIVGSGWFLHKKLTSAQGDPAPESPESLQTGTGISREEKIRELETLVEEKRQFLNMLAHGPIYGDPLHRAEHEARRHMENIRYERDELAKRIDALKQYSGEERIELACYQDLPQNPVPALYRDYVQAKQDLITLKASGLENQHPGVIAQGGIITDQRKGIERAVFDLEKLLNNLLRDANQHLKEAEKIHQEKVDTLTALPPDHFDLRRAADDFNQARKALQELRDEPTSESEAPQ